jgi:hypothetical protein
LLIAAARAPKATATALATATTVAIEASVPLELTVDGRTILPMRRLKINRVMGWVYVVLVVTL